MTEDNSATRRIAWEGVSFRVPASWDVSYHFGTRRKIRLYLEDDYAIRMKIQWESFSSPPGMAKVRRNYSSVTRRLRNEAQSNVQIENLPSGWFAAKYRMPDGGRLVTGYFVPRQSPLLFVFQLQFGRQDREDPEKTLHEMARTFTLYREGLVPWEAYDFSLEIPAKFRLLSTEFQAGKKFLAFQWRLRRLYLWQVSLAHIALRNHESVEDWAAQLLSGFKDIRARRFEPLSSGRLAARKRFTYPFGHYDELGRWCYNYYARCAHGQNENKLYVWVFNYRSEADLSHLDGSFGPYQLRGEDTRQA